MKAGCARPIPEIREELLDALRHYRAVLRTNPAEARDVLSGLFDERLTVSRVEGNCPWEVSGAGDLAGLFRRPPHNLASPPGFEPGFQP